MIVIINFVLFYLQYYTSEMMDDSSMHYAMGQPSPYMTGGQEPLRARDPERTHPPGPNQGAGGQYQMHAPRH